MTLLHFNIQYVAGGLEGFGEDMGLNFPDFDWSEEALEDAIITQSVEPVVALLEDHPNWTFSFEMQGFMVEVMDQRHSAVLDRIRTLAKAGRLELISFHYSDQLFLAYPKEDLLRSARRTRAVFAQHDLPLSGAVFTQEGQFAPGMIPVMDELGYTVAIVPRNLFGTQHADDPATALFQDGAITWFLTRGINDTGTGAQAQWMFADDGELLATGGMNPYLGPLFDISPNALADYESRVSDTEAAGFAITGVEACAQMMRTAGVATPTPPPLLDGTWQPANTDNLTLWMGGAGIWGHSWGYEDDNGVLTHGVRAHRVLHAIQGMAEAAGQPELLTSAWEQLALGQVSDATGWNPYRTEVAYAHRHLDQAILNASVALAELQPDWAGSSHWIDTQGEATAPAADGPDPGITPLSFELTQRSGSSAWGLDGATGLPVLTLVFDPAMDTEPPSVSFTWDGLAFRSIPALTESVAELDTAAFTLTEYGLALPLGVLGLDPTTWLVLDQNSVHLAGRFDLDAGLVTFADDTAAPDASPSWRFLLASTADEALQAALILNDGGAVLVDVPLPEDGERACQCAATGGPTLNAMNSLAFLLFAFLIRRRRPL